MRIVRSDKDLSGGDLPEGARSGRWLWWSFVALLICLAGSVLISLVVYQNPTITDARAYYFSLEEIGRVGLRAFFAWLYASTGKMEVFLYFVYWCFSSMIGGLSGFAFLNVFLSSLLFLMCAVALFGRTYDLRLPAARAVAIALVIYFFWYPSYANVLWVWRSQLATNLAIAGCLFYLSGWRLWSALFFVLACATHYVAVPLIGVMFVLYRARWIIASLSVGIISWAFFALGCAVGVLVVAVKRYFVVNVLEWQAASVTSSLIFVYVLGGFVSLGLVWIYCRRHDSAAWSVGGLLSHEIIKIILAFAFFMLGVVVVNNSHQDVMRILQSVFVFYVLALILVFRSVNGLGRGVITVCVVAGLLPTVKSILDYLT